MYSLQTGRFLVKALRSLPVCPVCRRGARRRLYDAVTSLAGGNGRGDNRLGAWGGGPPGSSIVRKHLGVAVSVLEMEPHPVAAPKRLGGLDGRAVLSKVHVAPAQGLLGVEGVQAVAETREARAGPVEGPGAAPPQSVHEGVEVLAVLLQATGWGVKGPRRHERVDALAGILEAARDPGAEAVV